MIVGLLFIFLLGLLIMSLGIYMCMNKLKFKIRGKKVQVKATNSEPSIVTIQGVTTTIGYKTTFDFEYEGIYRSVTLKTKNEYEIGNIYNAVYLNNNSNKCLALEGDSYYPSENSTSIAELILVFVGGLFAFVGLAVMLGAGVGVLMGGFATFMLLIFITSSLMSHLVKNKNKKANATIETGYATVYDLENNRIDETLIRYIPGENNNNIIDNSNNYETYSSNKIKRKRSFVEIVAPIFFLILFCGIGGMIAFAGGRETIDTLKMKYTYPSTTATITSTYTYKSYSSEKARRSNVPSYFIGVVYEYEVDGEKYTLNDKTGKGKGVASYKEGEKVKLYYEENNPNNAIAETEIGISFVPLIMGLLFIVVGFFTLVIFIKRK